MASLEVKTVQCQKYSLGFKMLDGSLHPTKVPFYMSPCLCRLICKMQKPTTTAEKKKKKLELANWLKEQCRCEVVLCSEGNQKLSVGSLYVILSLLPCWHHVLLQKMGFTQIKRPWPRWLHSYILRETLSTKRVKLLYHVHLEKCLHEYKAVNTGLCLLYYWPSCIYFSSFQNICSRWLSRNLECSGRYK